MKGTKNHIFFYAFVILWAVITLWNLATPAREFSEDENRYLKAWPSFSMERLLDGRFMDEVNAYLNDQFMARPYWVGAQSVVEFTLGKREINGVYIGKGALLGAIDEPDARITTVNTEGVNAFAERTGIPSYLLLVPSAAGVQPEKLPDLAEHWDECNYIDGIYGALSSGVTAVRAHDELLLHHTDYIYYRTDHHWTTYGAWLGYSVLYQAMELPARMHMRSERLSEQFLGTYHSKTGIPFVEADTITRDQNGEATGYDVWNGAETVHYDSIYFEEYLSQKDKYSYFLGQVQPVVTIHTAAEGERRLIVFKDSYAHCLMPMLMEDFAEIKLVDLRFINAPNMDEFLKVADYDAALFLYSTDVFSHQLGAGKLK